jgi:hypothetical protein
MDGNELRIFLRTILAKVLGLLGHFSALTRVKKRRESSSSLVVEGNRRAFVFAGNV